MAIYWSSAVLNSMQWEPFCDHMNVCAVGEFKPHLLETTFDRTVKSGKSVDWTIFLKNVNVKKFKFNVKHREWLRELFAWNWKTWMRILRSVTVYQIGIITWHCVRMLCEASINDPTRFTPVGLERPPTRGRPPKYYHPLFEKEKHLDIGCQKTLSKGISRFCLREKLKTSPSRWSPSDQFCLQQIHTTTLWQSG